MVLDGLACFPDDKKEYWEETELIWISSNITCDCCSVTGCAATYESFVVHQE
jgi:hypothetical protein